MSTQLKNISIILPACNEAAALSDFLPKLVKKYSAAEIIIINDGSSDATTEVAGSFPVDVVTIPYQMGNGAAIKAGARKAGRDILVFMDADGQHDPDDIQTLLDEMNKGYDMVVGARSGNSHASIFRKFANYLYNKIATWVTGHFISDLTSGFRAVNAKKFNEFLYMLPNGFSYPTTITMAFFRSGYSVSYVPIKISERTGNSHIKPLKDGIKFFLIIFRVGTYYSPLKIFFPVSLVLFFMGISNYVYTYYTISRFTNMSALLFLSSIFIFLIGLISEQITSLMYQKK